MIKKAFYIASILLSITLTGCQSRPKEGWIVIYDIVSWGSGYKVFTAHSEETVYDIVSWGSGYKVFKSHSAEIVYEISSWGSGYKVYF